MSFLFEEPAGREARPGWDVVPAGIILQVENLLQEKIIHGETVWGGYSPTAVFAARLASQRKVFIKGAHPGQDTHGTQILRQEIEVYKTAVEIKKISPAYYGHVSDGREDGWMLAVFDYIEATSGMPWTLEKITAVFERLSRLHFCDAKNIPLSLPRANERNYIEKFLRPAGGWLRIRDDKKIAEKFLSVFEDEKEGGSWLASALPRLCAEQEMAHETGGHAGIIHQDLRSDNILFDKSGKVYIIDWPNACYGPVVMDIAGFLPAINAESGFEAEALLQIYEDIAGIRLDRESLAIALASLSGHMADNVYREVPLKLPRLRWVQKTALWAMLQWAVVLVGIKPPPNFKGLLRS